MLVVVNKFVIDPLCDGALETPDDVLFGQPLVRAADDVVTGALIMGHSHDRDDVEGVVGLAVTTPVEPVPAGVPGRHRDQGQLIKVGKGGFRM